MILGLRTVIYPAPDLTREGGYTRSSEGAVFRSTVLHVG